MSDRYAPAATADDLRWLRRAVELGELSPPSPAAFSVGAVIVGADRTPLATGYSRERDPLDHAEEVALAKLAERWGPIGSAGWPELAGATIYSSMEPCSTRSSRPATCTQLILRAGIPRVVFAWPEPELFAECFGVELLRAAGVETVEVPDLAPAVRRTNAHLPGVTP